MVKMTDMLESIGLRERRMGGVSPPLTYTHCVVWDGAYFVFVTSGRTDQRFTKKRNKQKKVCKNIKLVK